MLQCFKLTFKIYLVLDDTAHTIGMLNNYPVNEIAKLQVGIGLKTPDNVTSKTFSATENQRRQVLRVERGDGQEYCRVTLNGGDFLRDNMHSVNMPK